jgi:flavodoxin
MAWIILGIAALAGGIQITSVVAIEYYQLRKNAKQLESFAIGQQPSNTLVVYFSRSGNTELMAYKIAELKKGNLLNLEASDYRIGYKGWLKAMVDARKKKAVISSQKVNLNAYDTIYIGSPIWLYSPAPPIFEFVRNNDLTAKKVILFNTLNSKFEQKYIDDFAQEVKHKGGHFIKHMYITRGRMTRQMDTQPFLDSVETQLLL